MRILGRTDQEISTFQEQGRVNPETPVSAPISGTIVQRRVGPGQYVSAGSSDPVFVIGDLSTVWLTAYVRETEASKVSVGEDVSFVVLRTARYDDPAERSNSARSASSWRRPS